MTKSIFALVVISALFLGCTKLEDGRNFRLRSIKGLLVSKPWYGQVNFYNTEGSIIYGYRSRVAEVHLRFFRNGKFEYVYSEPLTVDENQELFVGFYPESEYMYFSGIDEWELKKVDKTQLLLSHIDRGTKDANTVTVEINSINSKNLKLHTEKDGVIEQVRLARSFEGP